MKVIYQCFGGAHSSVVAAAIHLGLLPRDGVPSGHALRALERFDRTSSGDMGVPHFMGHDGGGNEIYVMGVGAAKGMAVGPLMDILHMLGARRGHVLMVPTLPSIGVVTRIGGFLSRSARLTIIGRPLVVIGILMDYPKLAQTVSLCERALMEREALT